MYKTSPEPTDVPSDRPVRRSVGDGGSFRAKADGAGSAVIAVHVSMRRWIRLFRLAFEPHIYESVKTTIHILGVALALFASSGCVMVSRESRVESWPEPTTAADLKQFEGMFSNRSVNRATGLPGDRSEQLYDFLTGQGHAHGRRGVAVEISHLAEETGLHVRLLDEKGLEIDSARLRGSADFQLTEGSLSLFGQFTGTHSRAGNLGAGVERKSSRLYVSSSDGLLGQHSETGAGFLFYFIPYVGGSKSWLLWPKLPSQ